MTNGDNKPVFPTNILEYDLSIPAHFHTPLSITCRIISEEVIDMGIEGQWTVHYDWGFGGS